MLKMSGYRLVLSVSFFVLCAVGGCISQEGYSERSVSRWLVWPELLEEAGLEILWQDELPMKKSENLERLYVLGNRMYAFSDRNYMVCLNSANGNFVFGRSIAPVSFPVVGLELYEDELFYVVGNELVELDAETGIEINAWRLAFGMVCPAVRNSSYFYLVGSDRRVHAVRFEDKVEVFEVAAENDSMITSIIADEHFFVFGTDSGDVVSVTADGPRRLWRFSAAGGIAGTIVRDAELLFFASEDTNVYKLNVLTGRLAWRYQTAAVLDREPRVTRTVVYQYVRDKGLTAIERGSGKFMWELEGGVDLLAEVDGKAYVITDAGTMVVMDNEKAKRLYSVNFSGVSRYAANVTDSRIYIADKTGRIACLKPIE